MADKKKKKVLATSFTTARKTKPVTIDGTPFVLRAYGGAELAEHQAAISSAAKFDADGKPAGIDLPKDTSLKYLSRGLFRVDPTTGSPTVKVPIEILRGWAGEVINGLTELLRDLNGETEEAEEEVKKDCDETETSETGSE